MSFIDNFLIWWLKTGRYPWSHWRRAIIERAQRNTPLPSAHSLDDVTRLLSQVQWTGDGPLHLYDAISFPGTVWVKRRDDCDGFAVLAAELLRRWDATTNPCLVTVMLRPIRQSHTVCVFRQGDRLRYFDNAHLSQASYGKYVEIAEQIRFRGGRWVCWDVVEPTTLRASEFHRVGAQLFTADLSGFRICAEGWRYAKG